MTDVQTPKRRWGERHDATKVRGIDSMHAMMPHMMPKRADNEALLVETIDLSAANAYLEKLNADNPEFKYTFFHIICAALAKTIALRPRLNRFYAGRLLYERNDIVLSFIVKKAFTDDGKETCAIITIDKEAKEGVLESFHEQVREIVYSTRKEGNNTSTDDKLDILTKLPRGVLQLVMKTLDALNYFGIYPDALRKDDPYFSTVFISNLGSIKMHADYHHLANWGTNSVFAIIGEKKPTPFYDYDGTCTVKEALEIGLTIDERIADGIYFAKSVKLLKHLMDNPELLELPLMTEVDY